MKLNEIVLTQILGIFLIFQTSFAEAKKVEAKKLVITGSSTMAPIITEIAKKYESLNKNIRVDVQSGGSSKGINDVRQGLADIGMSSRDLSNKEEIGVKVQTIAIDGVAFIVHSKNQITDLSSAQIAKLVKGKIKNWKELGGADAEIVFINRAKGRSELELISEYLKIPAEAMQSTLIAGENQEVVKLVSKNKNAISYLSLGTAETEIKNKAPLKITTLNGVQGAKQQVLDRSYPLVRPLLLVADAKLDADTENFVRFVLQKDSQKLFEKNNFIRAQ